MLSLVFVTVIVILGVIVSSWIGGIGVSICLPAAVTERSSGPGGLGEVQVQTPVVERHPQHSGGPGPWSVTGPGVLLPPSLGP